MTEPETKDDAEYVGDNEGINSVCLSVPTYACLVKCDDQSF